MSEPPAFTSFADSTVAKVIIGQLVGEYDLHRAACVHRGDSEGTMIDDTEASPGQTIPSTISNR